MAASVWIESSIPKPFGAVICRCRALTMPLVSEPSRPNGLPIATTGWPTTTRLESASASGRSSDAGAPDLQHGEVARRVGADHRRVVRGAVREPDRDGLGAVDDVRVRDDVALAVVDEPEPCEVCAAAGAEAEPLELTVISTTDCAARS